MYHIETARNAARHSLSTQFREAKPLCAASHISEIHVDFASSFTSLSS
jgi:hypothetical protein